MRLTNNLILIAVFTFVVGMMIAPSSAIAQPAPGEDGGLDAETRAIIEATATAAADAAVERAQAAIDEAVEEAVANATRELLERLDRNDREIAQLREALENGNAPRVEVRNDGDADHGDADAEEDRNMLPEDRLVWRHMRLMRAHEEAVAFASRNFNEWIETENLTYADVRQLLVWDSNDFRTMLEGDLRYGVIVQELEAWFSSYASAEADPADMAKAEDLEARTRGIINMIDTLEASAQFSANEFQQAKLSELRTELNRLLAAFNAGRALQVRSDQQAAAAAAAQAEADEMAALLDWIRQQRNAELDRQLANTMRAIQDAHDTGRQGAGDSAIDDFINLMERRGWGSADERQRLREQLRGQVRDGVRTQSEVIVVRVTPTVNTSQYSWLTPDDEAYAQLGFTHVGPRTVGLGSSEDFVFDFESGGSSLLATDGANVSISVIVNGSVSWSRVLDKENDVRFVTMDDGSRRLMYVINRETIRGARAAGAQQ